MWRRPTDRYRRRTGEFYRVPPSIIGAKPVQRPGPPIYLAAFSALAVRRAALLADGWHPVGVPLVGMAQMFTTLRAMADEAGRQDGSLALIVRANLHLSDCPLGEGRAIFAGSLEQIVADIAATHALGADELCFDLTFSPGVVTLDDLLGCMEQLYEQATRTALPAAPAFSLP